MSETKISSRGEMALGLRATLLDIRVEIEKVLSENGGLISAAARIEGRSVEEMADRALLSGAIEENDPRVSVMASPIARSLMGMPVGLADGAEKRLAEKIVNPAEAARQAAALITEAEKGVMGADLVALRGGRLSLERLADLGGRRALAGLGAAAPILEQAGIRLAKTSPRKASDAFILAMAFVEAERRERERKATRPPGGKDSIS